MNKWYLHFLLALSFASGASALIYEIVWFQMLELVIGSSAVSLGVLLATFMGGTCLGSVILPRLVPRRHDPLRVYAVLELGTAFLAILVLLLMPLAGSVYTSWSGDGLRGFLLRGMVAAAWLLPPTVLMGATFPALARGVEGTHDGVPWLGFFYGGNIAGGVLGCLLSGFYLLREHDVFTATYVAASVNASVAAVALALSGSAWRFNESGAKPATGPDPGGPSSHPLRSSLNGTVYAAIALSGFCAMAAETIWTRMLGLLFGASVYTFSIVLAVFLFGLGLGSGIGSLLCRSLARSHKERLALGWCQLMIAGALAWTAYSLAASLPFWPIDPSISSNVWFSFQLDLDRAFWALLPPTLLWGASFPLALAAVRSRGQDTGKLVAGVYAANTLGAIGGALGSSLFLMTWIGSQHTEQVLIALSAASGLLLLLPPGSPLPSSPERRRVGWSGVGLGAAAVLLTGLLIGTVPPAAPLLIAHGRYAATWAGKSDIIYAREGLNSPVAVSVFPNGVRTFHVAGKIQASNVPRDMRLQRMLGHLTALMPASARSVLVIGCGAGVTAGAASIDPRVERVTIVEIEPLVPQAAAAYFGRDNFDVIRNPKVQVRIDDGRHYLLTTKERFDAITADPLDPWVKGAANLYTREFLEAVKQHLNPGGVVTMYVQLFETNLDAVKSAAATFFEVFPHGTVWGNTYQGRGHDMLLLGQAEPLRVDLDEIERRLGQPDYTRVAQSLGEIGMRSSVDVFATYAGRGSDLTEWLRGAAINRDRNLRLQYLAGTGLNLDDSAAIYADMLAYRRFPADVFIGADGKVDELRQAIQDRKP